MKWSEDCRIQLFVPSRYVAEHSRCNVMVVEDEEQLNKVENIQDMLPELQAIIQYTGFPRSVITPVLTS